MSGFEWTDERLDDQFAHVWAEIRDLREESLELRRETRADMNEIRRDFAQTKLFMLGTLVTILASAIASHA
jgi:hypothetical protein